MKKKTNLEIGERIRQRREQFGYSREAFSEKIGISARFLTDVELGVKGTSIENLIKICDILEVSTDYILIGREVKADSRVEEMLLNVDKKYLPALEEIIVAFSKAVHLDQKVT